MRRLFRRQLRELPLNFLKPGGALQKAPLPRIPLSRTFGGGGSGTAASLKKAPCSPAKDRYGKTRYRHPWRRLALWQANHVKDSLEAVHPGLAVELNIIKTKGDIILDVPLAKVGGKGLFVKEIEEALLSGAADIAVHSMKDVPMELPEGLILGIVPEREDPTDLFLSVDYDSLENLPAGAVVGTSSLRRQAQVLAQRPDLEVVSLRGNVDTRLRKLTEGQFAAIIMATAA